MSEPERPNFATRDKPPSPDPYISSELVFVVAFVLMMLMFAGIFVMGAMGVGK